MPGRTTTTLCISTRRTSRWWTVRSAITCIVVYTLITVLLWLRAVCSAVARPHCWDRHPFECEVFGGLGVVTPFVAQRWAIVFVASLGLAPSEVWYLSGVFTLRGVVPLWGCYPQRLVDHGCCGSTRFVAMLGPSSEKVEDTLYHMYDVNIVPWCKNIVPRKFHVTEGYPAPFGRIRQSRFINMKITSPCEDDF